MYVNPHFKVHPATALAFAAARGFGLVIACDGGRPVAAHLPFRLIEQDGKVPKLEFHVARANPLGAIAEKGGTWLVAVQGHDAYVSPDWYASADQVPTWLYEAVHLSGPVRVIPGDHTRGHTERLSGTFEAWLAPKPAWTPDKVADKRREMLLKGIVAVEMTIETIEGNFKLNQHKSDEDQIAIANALGAQSDPSAQEIAKRMKALRPHLDYASVSPIPPAERGRSASEASRVGVAEDLTPPRTAFGSIADASHRRTQDGGQRPPDALPFQGSDNALAGK